MVRHRLLVHLLESARDKRAREHAPVETWLTSWVRQPKVIRTRVPDEVEEDCVSNILVVQLREHLALGDHVGQEGAHAGRVADDVEAAVHYVASK